MSEYIKHPLGENCTWRSGPPPEVGWWPASACRNPRSLRFWNGSAWSVSADPEMLPGTASILGSVRSTCQDRIEWTDRWWEKKA